MRLHIQNKRITFVSTKGNNNNNKTNNMKTKDFIEAIENGKAQVLTVAKAQELKGKSIYWMYIGDSANYNEICEMIVGDITTEYDYYAKNDAERLNRMSEERTTEAKETKILLDSEGKWNYLKAYTGAASFFKEETFTCSDADRKIYFIACE